MVFYGQPGAACTYDFCDPLPEECPCPVCLEVQVEPYQLTCCGKIFCKACMDQLIRKKNRCPNCRSNFIQDKRYFPDVSTERKIKHLRVRCSNKKRGCEWVGHLKDLKELHIPKCPNHLVPCTNMRRRKNTILRNYRCDELIQRSDLHKHMTELCEWRQATCSHCNMNSSYNFISGDHTKECPCVLVVCPNEGCLVKIKRKSLPEHCSTCPKEVIACRYSSVGCKQTIKRENVQSHNQECMAEHLDKAVEKFEKSISRIERILETKASKWKARENRDIEDDRDDSDVYGNDDYCPDCGFNCCCYEDDDYMDAIFDSLRSTKDKTS